MSLRRSITKREREPSVRTNQPNHRAIVLLVLFHPTPMKNSCRSVYITCRMSELQPPGYDTFDNTLALRRKQELMNNGLFTG